MATGSTDTAVLIIGAGFGGICTALDLIRHNQCRDFIILEKSAGVGGVWYDNTYPGCAVDVQSVVYSFSFAQNSEWTQQLPQQKEILAYLTSTAERNSLYKHIRFGSTATDATWNDTTQQWETTVRLAAGSREAEVHDEYVIRSSFLVSAVGQLSEPKLPSIPGLDGFAGKVMHSSRWDWSYDLRGKRVAVIGTGCSGAQIVPEVAKVAKHVTVFQRQPHWIVPRGDEAIPESTRRLYRYLPFVQRSRRRRTVGENEAAHQSQAFASAEDNVSLQKEAYDTVRQQLPHRPDLWDKLTPKYPVGCKRLVISDLFLPALGRENVALETRRIRDVVGQTIRVEEDEDDESQDVVVGKNGALADEMKVEKKKGTSGTFDVVVCATGFHAQQFLHGLRVKGRHGVDLAELWKEGAFAYLGTCVPGMPNFGIILGPNTGLLHNSFLLMIEAQSRYISGMTKPVLEARRRSGQQSVRGGGGGPQASGGEDAAAKNCVDDRREDGGCAAGKAVAAASSWSSLSLSPRADVTRRYNSWLQEQLRAFNVNDAGCRNWYKAPSGKITNLWPGLVLDFQLRLQEVRYDDFDMVVVGPGGEPVHIDDAEGTALAPCRVGRAIEEPGLLDAITPALGLAIVGLSSAAVLALVKLHVRGAFQFW